MELINKEKLILDMMDRGVDHIQTDDLSEINQIIAEQEVVNDWMPCEKKMPEKPYGCLVTVWDCNPLTGEEFENLYPEFVGWDGETWNDYDGKPIPLEVIAWMPLPKPYKAESEGA